MVQVQVPTEGKQERRDLCAWLVHADHDYVAARLLLLNGLWKPALYHTQQAVEKYLKAFLLARQCGTEKSHDLDKLRKKAVKFDDWLGQPKVIEFCENLTQLDLAARYPYKLGIGTSTGLLYVLDWFAFNLRNKVPFPGNCGDDIAGLSTGDSTILNGIGPSGGLGVLEAFFTGNEFFKYYPSHGNEPH